MNRLTAIINTKILGIFTITVSLLMIAGYPFGIPVLENSLSINTMPFNAAICFFLCGIVTLLINQRKMHFGMKVSASVLACIVLLIASVSLCQYIFQWDAGIDQLFRKARISTSQEHPGRMDQVVCSLFIVAAMFFLLMPNKRFHIFIRAIVLICVAVLALIFFVYLTLNPYPASLMFLSVLHSSFVFIALYTAIFLSFPFSYLKVSFQHKIAGFFAMVVLVMAVIFLAINSNNKRSEQALKSTESSSKILLHTQKVLALALNAETETRGFLISGETVFSDNFYKTIAGLRQSIDQLEKLAVSDSIQRKWTDSLKVLADQNIRVRRQLIDLKKSTSSNAAYDLFRTGIPKQSMDKLKAVVANIERQETQQLIKRQAVYEDSTMYSRRVIHLFYLIIILLLLICFYIIYKNTSARNNAEKEIKNLNATLEKRVEKKAGIIAEKEKEFRFLLENMHEGIQVIDFNWRYAFVNKTLVQQSKFSSEELVGFTMMEKYPGIENTELFKVLDECMRERKPMIMENEFTYPDGSVSFMGLSIQPVPKGLFILSMDISERKNSERIKKELNEDLKKRAAELLDSNAELERFAYVASHDLQEPLRMISSFLQLLEKKLTGTLDETGKRYINFALDGSERMKKLINDLLEYSRLGSSKENKTAVDCNKILNTVQSFYDLSLRTTETTLVVKPLPVITAIEPQILQLFQNLVGNAIKYRKDEAMIIEVGCIEQKEVWQFYVKDNGIGIDPKFFDKIFIVFQRLHNKSEYSGTGIGLSICKKIVHRHGGHIWVESAAGGGSTFYFTILKNKL